MTGEISPPVFSTSKFQTTPFKDIYFFLVILEEKKIYEWFLWDGWFRCTHYRRRCKIRAPCCNEIFDCRHCHNEAKVTLLLLFLFPFFLWLLRLREEIYFPWNVEGLQNLAVNKGINLHPPSM